MASLRRLPNSPYWIACLTLPDGRRTNRSTKTTDRRIARRLATEWQDAADQARQGRFVEMQARAVLNAILTAVGGETLPVETVEKFLGDWVNRQANPRTARRYARVVDLFLAHLGTRRQTRLDAITHQDILAFIEGRERIGVAAKTLRVEVRALNAAFNLARKLGGLSANPVEKALALHPLGGEGARQREGFTPAQVKALLGAAEGDWRTLVLLGYYTGARLSDCARLRWSSVNSRFGVIDYTAQKTGRRVVVPLHPELAAHLEQLPPDATGCVCPVLAGKATGGKTGLSAGFKRLMERAGVDAGTDGRTGLRRFSRLSFHSLRHAFNSALANGGVDQETRMALTGHSSVAVNNDYTHLDLAKLRGAIETMPALAQAVGAA